jgi:hypothetical protein
MKLDNNIKIKKQSYCECGCGKIVKRKYAWGHYIRIKNPMSTEIYRKKVSLALMGNKYGLGNKKTEKERKRISAFMIGKQYALGCKRSEETKKKMSLAQIGNKKALGHKHTEEAKRKMSLSQIGNCKALGHKISEAGRIKLSNSSKKRIASKESREKMSKSHFGLEQTEQTKLKKSKEKSHLWRGGISKQSYPITFNRKLKIKIRNRDNFMCQYIGCGFVSKTIPVHHINYNKKDSSEINLISLCRSHHSKTNLKNREYWTNYYQNIIKSKYK